MIRKQSLVILMSAAASVAVVAGGCHSKKEPTRTDQTIQPAVMTDTNERMSELQRKSGKLSSIVKQLPGRDAKEDRELVAQAFDAAHDSLTMMAGPEPGGAMRQQLRIIDNIRQFLRSGDQKLSYDPAVDAGLRATHSALDGVRERLFPNDQKVGALVGELGERLGELDQVRGPMHSVVVAQVFQSASNAIDTMGGILNTRSQMVSQYTPPAPAPAPSAPPPVAAPAAASAPPSAPSPARVAAPAPAPAPAPPRAPAPPPSPAPAPTAAAQQPPTSEQYQQLQKQNEELQRQLQQLQQQQQPQGQPAAAPVPPPAPAAPEAPAAPAAPPPPPAPDLNK